MIAIDLPNLVQCEAYTCGAAALLAVASYYGVGPDSEAAIVDDMAMGSDGSDPAHLLRAATRYGLSHREYRPMSRHELVRCVDRGRPVIVMLQAWPDAAPPHGFTEIWDTGHWVVAIGHDARGVYFADPSLPGARGFLDHRALAERWHDIEGPDARPVQRYGLALWRQRVVNRVVLDRVKPIG